MLLSFVLPAVLSPATVGDTRINSDTSPSGQIAFIKGNIPNYISILWNNAGVGFFNSFFGKQTLTSSLYYAQFPDWTYTVSLIALIVLTFINYDGKEMKSIGWMYRLLMFYIIVGTVCFIWTALYISFTNVTASVIEGVQGRYFLPLIVPLLMIVDFNIINIKIPKAILNTVVCEVATVSLYACVFYSVLMAFAI